MVHAHTVNVVNFAGVTFREKVGKTFHMGEIFTITLFYIHKVIWALFSRKGYFSEETNHKNYPNMKISMFTFYKPD